MARSVDAEIAVETALSPSSSPMPQVWLAGGGLSLGRAVGAGDYGAVECGSDIGSGDELARDGAPLFPPRTERTGRKTRPVRSVICLKNTRRHTFNFQGS